MELDIYAYTLKKGSKKNTRLANKTSKKYKLKEDKLPSKKIITYQSKAELNFIKECVKKHIEIMDGDVVPYIFKGEIHSYFVDFKIKENGKWKLVEIKGKHKWYYEDLKSGLLKAKEAGAVKFSKDNNYAQFKFILV